MKVLLVRPPRRHAHDVALCVPPLGLAYVASALREAGHEVDILDAFALRWTWARLETEFARRRPDLVGLGAMTPTADLAARAARLARPHARWLVLGGPHPTATGASVFDEMPLDAAVSGEGERVAPLLLDWLQRGSTGDPPTGVLVPGMPLMPAVPEPDLTTLPAPAWDLLPMERYRYLLARHDRVASMVTSRGCPFRCTFCDKSVSGSRWRARPAPHVADEIQRLVADHGVRFVSFYDDNFTLRRSRVVEICEEVLRRGLEKTGLTWKAEGRVDSVDEDLLRLMHRAGCRLVAYGVESGNADTLALLRKDIRLDEARGAFAATRRAGIRSLAYVILGAPGEDAAAVRRTMAFCREIGADYVQFSTLTAMPGTPLFEQAHHRVSGAGANPLDGDLHRATVSDLSAVELARLQREAWLGFYLRPRPLARLARDTLGSGAWTEALRLGRALAAWA